jgi:hypothetical protein
MERCGTSVYGEPNGVLMVNVEVRRIAAHRVELSYLVFPEFRDEESRHVPPDLR